MPVSATLKCRREQPSPRASSRTEMATCPCSVNLMALPTRFVTICFSRTGSPTTPDGYVRSAMSTRISSPFWLARTASGFTASFDRVDERERNRLELQLARLDLREVEDVVEDRQQRLGRALDGVQAVGLIRRELRVERQRRHADDAVHRRANLVAHVRQELRLGAVGRLRRLVEATPRSRADGG